MEISEKRTWWKEGVVYQIYPRSFMDTNGDGIGDLNGIREKLDYLKLLGVDILWLCPVYKSPNDDNGYDISDYRNIMEDFGTLADFDALLAAAHAKGMRIVMDLVVNHTSDEHPWFVESRKSKNSKYRDYYVWKDGKNGGAPNNWGACFGGSTWQLDDATNMYYLHMFSKKQPDLNWENPAVRDEIFDMMTWWGNKGIDGFRMDVITMISKVQTFPDGVLNGKYGVADPFVNNGPRVHEYLKDMYKKVISKFDWMTVGEGSGAAVEDALEYTGFDKEQLNMVFTFEHVNLGARSKNRWDVGKVKLTELKTVFTRWQNGLEGRGWNSLYWDNHDQPRAVSRFGDDRPQYRELSAKMLAVCLHFLKGTPYIYQGEELGMTNTTFNSPSDFKDIESINGYRDMLADGIEPQTAFDWLCYKSRDNARTPMHWSAAKNAGFTNGTPWITVNPNYPEINAKEQVRREDSVFNFYKKLIALRHSSLCMVYGRYDLLLPDSEQLYAYTRTLGDEKLLVVSNFTAEPVSYTRPKEFENAKQIISNYPDTNSATLRPYEAFALATAIEDDMSV